jgi:rare lipoprotein A
MPKVLLILLGGGLLMMSAACGRRQQTAARPSSIRKGWTQEGVASWYGHPYHGRKTASGERYDMEQMTAAHKTLPFGVEVEVRNKVNDRRVTVRINDRGPFVAGRIIDLSRAAAREIDLIRPGTAPVKIRVVRTR